MEIKSNFEIKIANYECCEYLACKVFRLIQEKAPNIKR